MPLTRQDLTLDHFYSGDLGEEIGHEPKLMPSWTILDIGSLGGLARAESHSGLKNIIDLHTLSSMNARQLS